MNALSQRCTYGVAKTGGTEQLTVPFPFLRAGIQHPGACQLCSLDRAPPEHHQAVTAALGGIPVLEVSALEERRNPGNLPSDT